MRNKEVIYVANSFSVEATKFLILLGDFNTVIQGGVTTVTSAYGLRNIIKGTGQVPSVITSGSSGGSGGGP